MGSNLTRDGEDAFNNQTKEELAAVVSTTRLLTDEDFRKIEIAELRKHVNVGKAKKRPAQLEKGPKGDLVTLGDIENIYKKQRHDKEAGLETVKVDRGSEEIRVIDILSDAAKVQQEVLKWFANHHQGVEQAQTLLTQRFELMKILPDRIRHLEQENNDLRRHVKVLEGQLQQDKENLPARTSLQGQDEYSQPIANPEHCAEIPTAVASAECGANATERGTDESSLEFISDTSCASFAGDANNGCRELSNALKKPLDFSSLSSRHIKTQSAAVENNIQLEASVEKRNLNKSAGTLMDKNQAANDLIIENSESEISGTEVDVSPAISNSVKFKGGDVNKRTVDESDSVLNVKIESGVSLTDALIERLGIGNKAKRRLFTQDSIQYVFTDMEDAHSPESEGISNPEASLESGIHFLSQTSCKLYRRWKNSLKKTQKFNTDDIKIKSKIPSTMRKPSPEGLPQESGVSETVDMSSRYTLKGVVERPRKKIKQRAQRDTVASADSPRVKVESPDSPTNEELVSPNISQELTNIDQKNTMYSSRATLLGTPALLKAAAKQSVTNVKKLLAKGVKPGIADTEGITALHVAAELGRVQIVRCLVEAGADLKACCSLGRTPLHVAAAKGHVEVCRFMVDAGASPFEQDSKNITPLYESVRCGRLPLVKKFTSVPGVFDSSLVKLAAKLGHVEITRHLLRMGLDTEFRSKAGRTALHCAVKRGNKVITEQLLKYGASVATTDRKGRTALHIAALHGHEKLIAVLAKRHVDISPQDSNRATPLHLAALNGHVASVKVLLKKGAAFNLKDSTGNTALAVAASRGYEEVCLALLYGGSSPMDQTSTTPALHAAAKAGHLSVVQLLLKAGALPNLQDRAWCTPLHLAAEGGHLPVVRLLLQNGVAANIMNIDGHTAAMVATTDDIRKMLQVTACLPLA